MADTIDLYIAADGLTGRDGGPYLDQEERRIAEERRAVVEDREPDLENPPATAGTVLVTASQLLDAASVNAPSKLDSGKTEGDVALVNTIAESDASTITPHSTVPADAFTPVPESKPAEDVGVSEEVPAEEEAGYEDPFAGTDAESK
jgi:hypothetical protein